MKKKSPNYFAIDIGSSKISAIAARANRQGVLNIVAQSVHSSLGLKSGVVTDIVAAENSVMSAIYQLEKVSDKNIKEVIISLSGIGAKSYYINNSIKIGSSSNILITKTHVKKLIDKVLLEFNVPNQDVIHCFPVEFSIDNNCVIDEPIGLYANQLSCQMHIITVNSLMLANIINCFTRCQINVSEVMLAVYTAGLSCLTKEEQEIGALIIDIGSHTTSFAVFFNKKLIYIGYVSLGSFHVTLDIAKAFGISIKKAEKLKILYGAATSDIISKPEIIKIGELEDNYVDKDLSISSLQLSKIIYSRLKPIFEQIRDQYNNIEIDSVISNKLVVTGGGASLQGLKNLITSVFNKHVRLAKPEYITGFKEGYNPYTYSAVVGIIKSKMVEVHNNFLVSKSYNSLVKKMILWIKENI